MAPSAATQVLMVRSEEKLVSTNISNRIHAGAATRSGRSTHGPAT